MIEKLTCFTPDSLGSKSKSEASKYRQQCRPVAHFNTHKYTTGRLASVSLHRLSPYRNYLGIKSFWKERKWDFCAGCPFASEAALSGLLAANGTKRPWEEA